MTEPARERAARTGGRAVATYSWDELDGLVETDALRLRDVAWKLQDRIAKVREICEMRGAESIYGLWTDVDTIWPSEILTVLDGEGEKADADHV